NASSATTIPIRAGTVAAGSPPARRGRARCGNTTDTTAVLAIGWGRRARSSDVLDIVASDRDQRGDAFRPQRRNDAGRAATPIIAGECGALETERVEKFQEIAAECGLLPGTRGLRVEKPGRPIAAQIRDQHA